MTDSPLPYPAEAIARLQDFQSGDTLKKDIKLLIHTLQEIADRARVANSAAAVDTICQIAERIVNTYKKKYSIMT